MESQKKLTASVKAGGCAAKLSPAELSTILRSVPKQSLPELMTDMGSFEDAAVYKVSEDVAIIQTVDFFPPLVDDPFLYGRIAATNALSDIYAMGGKPIFALNILCFPTCDFPLEIAQQILAGGATAVAEAGAVLAGGHSIQSPEPIYGLSVTGLIHPQQVLSNGGARAGDAVVVSKAIGSGIALLAEKGGLLAESSRKALFDSLCQLNAGALAAARKYDLHATTDITGFGLAGHLHEMAKAASLELRVKAKAIPLFAGVLEFAELGLVPGGSYGNRKAYEKTVILDPDLSLSMGDLVFDPQSSGGLAFALCPAEAILLQRDLKNSGLSAAIIGNFAEGRPGLVEIVGGDN